MLKFVSQVRQLLAADDFSRRHFQMHLFFKTGPNCLQRLSGDNTCIRFREDSENADWLIYVLVKFKIYSFS